MGEVAAFRTPRTGRQRHMDACYGGHQPVCISSLGRGTRMCSSKQLPLVKCGGLLVAGFTHTVGTVSWPLPRAEEERLVGSLQPLCQHLGRYTVGLGTHACRCLWNEYQSHELAPCLATPVAKSPLSPHRCGSMNVSLITLPHNLEINASRRNVKLSHRMHWR